MTEGTDRAGTNLPERGGEGGGVDFPRRIDLKLVHGIIVSVRAPAYVMGIFDNVKPTGAAKSIDALLGGSLTALVQDRMIGGREGEISILPTPRRAFRADHIAFAGLGPISTFAPNVLDRVAQNIARVFITTQIHSFATVLIGSNAGATVSQSLNALLNGLLRGLDRRDPDHDFRSIYVCESNDARYLELVAAARAYRLPEGLRDIEIVRKTIDFRMISEPEPAQRSSDGLELTYLFVEQPEGGSQLRKYHFSVLTAGGNGGAAISKEEQAVDFIGKKSLEYGLDKARRLDPNFGAAISQFYLPQSIREAVLGSLDRARSGYLVVNHDRGSADIPWEAMPMADGVFPALKGGLSRKLKVEGRIAGRSLLPKGAKLRMLMVRNPTCDLAGADTECEEIVKMFAMKDIELKELKHDEATREAILAELARGDYDILHYAGHAIFDRRHHGNSGLICHGRRRLKSKDLAQVETLPQLIVLNGCQSVAVRDGCEQPIEPEIEDEAPLPDATERSFWERLSDNLGDQATLAEALMMRGAMNIVGTYWPVGDAAALHFSRNFYASLLAGDRLGLAMSKGRGAIYDMKSGDWANYIHYGDPEYLLRRS